MIWQKKIWCCIAAVELLVLVAIRLFYGNREEMVLEFAQEELIDDSENAAFYLDYSTSSQYVASPHITLPRGMYTLEAECESAGDPKLLILYHNQGDTDSYHGYRSGVSGAIPIEGKYLVSCDFRVPYASPIQVRGVFTEPPEEGEYLLVRNIRIRTADCDVRNHFFRAALFLLLCDIVFWGVWQKKRGHLSIFEKKEKVTWKALTLLVVFTSLPLAVDYLFLNSHDLYFHLMRIEGIRAGLESGMFPVRVQPWWLNGHGYAVSVFYGDFFLYFPALLHYFGVSLQAAYKCYVVMINVLTVGIAYYSFSKMSRPKIGLACTVLYSLNIYRLCCIYTRAAVGEYTAMTFMPLILYGLWKLYMLPEDSGEHKNSWFTLTIGCTGIFLSHMITTEITAVFILLSAVILWKRFFRKKTFVVILKTAAATVLLNLWFLFPFLDYMANGTYMINRNSGYGFYEIEGNGAMISQLLLGGYTVFGDSQGAAEGSRNEMPLTVGIALMAVLVGWILFCAGKEGREKEEKKKDWLAVFLCVLSLFMTTCHFPYSGLAVLVPLCKLPIGSIQFPWRFLSVAALFLVWLFCLILKKNWIPENNRRIFAGMLVFFSLYQGMVYMGACLKEAIPYRVYQAGNMSTMEMIDSSGEKHESVMGGEYLPIERNTRPDRSVYVRAYIDELSVDGTGVTVESWTRDRAAVQIILQNKSKNVEQVEVPLIFYKGYQAVTDSGEKLEILPGASYRILVSVPAGFSGQIRVEFKEPGCWRVCEAISLLTFVFLVLRATGLRVTHKQEKEFKNNF